MNLTSRMTALLGEMRRQRNGAVADSMGYRGRTYGLNYGVSLPTVRELARAEGRDDEYARLLWRQDVRELRLAALHVADPACLTAERAAEWAAGIDTSELAEEAAFALLSQTEALPALFGAWTAEGSAPLLGYAALLAAARRPDPKWCGEAARVLGRAEAEGPEPGLLKLLVQGAAALSAAVGALDGTSRDGELRAARELGTPAGEALREELAWRL